MRVGVNSSIAAVASIARIRTGVDNAKALGFFNSLQDGKRGFMRRLFSRIFRRFFSFIRPVFFRYREYMNRPILEQIARMDASRMSRQGDEGVISRLERIENYAMHAARRTAVSCGDGRVLVRSSAGFVMCSTSDPALLACIIDSGDLERGTRLLIERLVQPNMVFLDIGANIGLHTLAAGRAMQGVGRVVAFEPYAPTRELLSESIFINGLSGIVEIHEAAVSTKSGIETLYLGKVSGHHSLYPLAEESASDTKSAKIRLVRLTDVIPSGIQVDLIKIDVEGAELDVLESAKPFIASNPNIALIVEFGPSHLERTGVAVDDWFGVFAALGLDCQAIDDLDGTLSFIEKEKLVQRESVNLLFSRRDSEIWKRACVGK